MFCLVIQLKQGLWFNIIKGVQSTVQWRVFGYFEQRLHFDSKVVYSDWMSP